VKGARDQRLSMQRLDAASKADVASARVRCRSSPDAGDSDRSTVVATVEAGSA